MKSVSVTREADISNKEMDSNSTPFSPDRGRDTDPSLGEQLVRLSLEIEDRSKQGDLLQKLIRDQDLRNAKDATTVETEHEALLQQIAAEGKEGQTELAHATESLARRKKSLENKMAELLTKKKEAETMKKENIAALRREVAGEKEKAYEAHKQERSRREKAWFERRASEVQRLTWKGIAPNVERLARSHEEQREEIEAKTEIAKKRLELQCETELSERLQAFERNERQANTCFAQRNSFAQALLREQNEHDTRVMKLKDRFAQEEEAAREMYSGRLETLAEEHAAALAETRRSGRAPRLERELAAARDARKQELETTLERVGEGEYCAAAKGKWEEEWRQASALRIEERKKSDTSNLLRHRKKEIDALIKRSILDQRNSAPTEDVDALAAAHKERMASLNKALARQRECNEVIKRNITAIIATQDRCRDDTKEAESKLGRTKAQLEDITNKIEQARLQHEETLTEESSAIDHNLLLFKRRKDDLEKELDSVKNKHDEELREHTAEMDEAKRQHEAALDALERRAAAALRDVDGEARAVRAAAREQEAHAASARRLCAQYAAE